MEVSAGGEPVLLVDEVDDKALELRRVLDPVLRLAEDRAERARLLRQADQDPSLDDLELGALGVEEPLPGVLGRNDLLRVQSAGSALMSHLEEQQIRQLLCVLNDTDTVVTEDIAVGPELVDQVAGVRHSRGLCFNS